jgi:hypothetical protein
VVYIYIYNVIVVVIVVVVVVVVVVVSMLLLLFLLSLMIILMILLPFKPHLLDPALYKVYINNKLNQTRVYFLRCCKIQAAGQSTHVLIYK